MLQLLHHLSYSWFLCEYLKYYNHIYHFFLNIIALYKHLPTFCFGYSPYFQIYIKRLDQSLYNAHSTSLRVLQYIFIYTEFFPYLRFFQCLNTCLIDISFRFSLSSLVHSLSQFHISTLFYYFQIAVKVLTPPHFFFFVVFPLTSFLHCFLSFWLTLHPHSVNHLTKGSHILLIISYRISASSHVTWKKKDKLFIGAWTNNS